MTVFVDTSAIYALLDADDQAHAPAADWLRGPGADPSVHLLTHSYVVVETAALAHRRLGSEAVRALLDGLLPALRIQHVDKALFDLGLTAYRAGLRRGASLVDQVSFSLMREQRINRAFCFDTDFRDEGFALVPG